MSSKNLVDYIIVGSGAAGAALAHRLGSNPQNRVLVIEAGESDRHQRYLMPARFTQASADPQHQHRHASRVFGAGRMDQRRTGCLMEGSTTPSGLIWGRDTEADYEAWEAVGATGWNWSRFLEAFTEIERHALDATVSRVGGASRPAEAVGPQDATAELWLDALARQGIDAVADLNGSPDRAAYVPHPMSTGVPQSRARALLRGCARRRNVRVRPHCTARRILFEGTTAIGVEAQTSRGTVRFWARREVILCAGTMGSPLLLERSGVGDPEVLTTAGVHLVAESQAVGANLRQRRGAALTLRFNGVPDHGRESAPPIVGPRSRFRPVLRRAAVSAGGGAAVLAVTNSGHGTSSPDMELLFTPVVEHDGLHPGAVGATAVTVAFYPRSPTSIGSVHITGPTLADPPRLVPGYLSTDHDNELTLAAFARTREILATEPFASTMTEVSPGPEVTDTRDTLRYVMEHGFTRKHEVGTCALGADGAVDEELRVRGTHRLRVADASVMPVLTTGDTEAASLAVGWIAGDILRNANTRSR
ncbi:GMC family oxidoreductase [Streptomyces sp. NPDC018026]|uniref:GMC family oxidoreductase n=1 Tax=Streptomyces sp. NPDC018026 TaxID=3365031 RepID=UPI0037993F5A